MSEVTIEPIPLVWMGSYEDLPETDDGWQVGWAFFGLGHALSEHYKANVASVREPITVMCPARRRHDGTLQATTFCIDSHPTDEPSAAWTVTVDLDSLVVGQQPMISVAPSIHLVGMWHGWLEQGILHN